MIIWDWFKEQFNKTSNTLELDMVLSSLAAETFYMELAVQACTNLIANAVSRAEFITFEEGEEVKKDNYYLLNVEPNPNKSASKFWRDVISRMIRDNEALVIQQDGYFYCADTFSLEKKAFKDYRYENITIDNFDLNNKYYEPDVFHFELHNDEIKKVLDRLNKSYAKLVAASQDNYKRNNSRKITVEVPTNYPETEEAQNKLKDLFQNKFKDFFDADGGAVIPLYNGIEVDELESNIGVKGGADNSEIRDFIDDIFDFVAMGFQVPPQLLKSEVQDLTEVINSFLTFCVNPIAETVDDEINRKLYGKSYYLNNTYTKADTSNIKAVDITNIANSLEVLTRIGGYSIDDTLKKLGKEPINNEWSQARWMTKNYQEVEKRYDSDD